MARLSRPKSALGGTPKRFKPYRASLAYLICILCLVLLAGVSAEPVRASFGYGFTTYSYKNLSSVTGLSGMMTTSTVSGASGVDAIWIGIYASDLFFQVGYRSSDVPGDLTGNSSFSSIFAYASGGNLPAGGISWPNYGTNCGSRCGFKIVPIPVGSTHSYSLQFDGHNWVAAVDTNAIANVTATMNERSANMTQVVAELIGGNDFANIMVGVVTISLLQQVYADGTSSDFTQVPSAKATYSSGNSDPTQNGGVMLCGLAEIQFGWNLQPPSGSNCAGNPNANFGACIVNVTCPKVMNWGLLWWSVPVLVVVAIGGVLFIKRGR